LSSRDTSSQIFDNSIVALTAINDFVAFGRVDECFDEGDAVACDADDRVDVSVGEQLDRNMECRCCRGGGIFGVSPWRRHLSVVGGNAVAWFKFPCCFTAHTFHDPSNVILRVETLILRQNLKKFPVLGVRARDYNFYQHLVECWRRDRDVIEMDLETLSVIRVL
jgi:hypothetical protein